MRLSADHVQQRTLRRFVIENHVVEYFPTMAKESGALVVQRRTVFDRQWGRRKERKGKTEREKERDERQHEPSKVENVAGSCVRTRRTAKAAAELVGGPLSTFQYLAALHFAFAGDDAAQVDEYLRVLDIDSAVSPPPTFYTLYARSVSPLLHPNPKSTPLPPRSTQTQIFFSNSNPYSIHPSAESASFSSPFHASSRHCVLLFCKIPSSSSQSSLCLVIKTTTISSSS